jgi:hypothetical protein
MNARRKWQVTLVAGLVVAGMSACGREDVTAAVANPTRAADTTPEQVEDTEAAFEDEQRELAGSLRGSDAVVRGRVAIDGERNDPFPGQVLFEARLTVEEVLLAPQVDMLGRPLRDEGDLNLTAREIPLYLPVDEAQAAEIMRIVDSGELLVFTLFANVSSGPLSPWMVTAMGSDRDGAFSLVHPLPVAELNAELALAQEVTGRPALETLILLVDELRRTSQAELDGGTYTPGPIEAVLDAAAEPPEGPSAEEAWAALAAQDRSLLEGVAPDSVLADLEAETLVVQMGAEDIGEEWAVKLYNDIGIVHYFSGGVGSHYAAVYLPAGRSELNLVIEGEVDTEVGRQHVVRVPGRREGTLVFDVSAFLAGEVEVGIETVDEYRDRTSTGRYPGAEGFLVDPVRPAG